MVCSFSCGSGVFLVDVKRFSWLACSVNYWLKSAKSWSCNFWLFQKQLQQYQTSAKQVPLNKRPPERGGCFPKRIWQSWNVTKQFANATNCLNDFWNVFATQNSKSYADSMTQQKDTKWQNFSMNTVSSTSATGIPMGTTNFKTLTISDVLYRNYLNYSDLSRCFSPF